MSASRTIVGQRVSVPSRRMVQQPPRTLAVSSRAAHSCWATTSTNELRSALTVPRPQGTTACRRETTMMGNKAAGGPFAPLVVVVRNAMGAKEFNKFRGKAISVHSQVIKDFCKQLGVDTRQVQGVIRLAKKNGEKLGFLA